MQIIDDEADDLATLSSVFDLEELPDGTKRAVVARPRECNMSRELLRDPRWANRIRIARQNNHFIFSVESSGALPARDLVREALKLLRAKADRVTEALDDWMRDGGSSSSEGR